MLEITVKQRFREDDLEWPAEIEDIKKVLDETVSYIQKELRSPIEGKILVRNNSKLGGPIVLYQKRSRELYQETSEESSFTVLLFVVEGEGWPEYTYQFAHEFCHILSDYENLEDNKNKWFHESICHIASFFTLWKMSKISYADQMIKDASEISQSNMNFIDWLESKEKELRDNPINKPGIAPHLAEKLRVYYKRIALELLPLFKKYPKGGWNAVRQLPKEKFRNNKRLLKGMGIES